MGFTGFYWVLLGFTGFYWVLHTTTAVRGGLSGPTGRPGEPPAFAANQTLRFQQRSEATATFAAIAITFL